MSISRDLIWTDHQGGKLGYYLDDEGCAVLCDYVGETSVLFIPSYLGDAWNDVSYSIPDDSFLSCSNVELIIVDCRYADWDFGYFTFKNCKELKGLIRLIGYISDEDYGISMCHDNGDIHFNEFSFANSDYSPKKIVMRDMAFDRYDISTEKIEEFINAIICRGLEDELLESLRTSCDYTDIAFESCDNSKWIEKNRRKGIDIEALTAVSLCWNDVK